MTFGSGASLNATLTLFCKRNVRMDPGSTLSTANRDFVDHFHTCFVLKALAKIETLKPNADCRRAIERGAAYYLANLLDERKLPKPFSKAPRMTVYRRELYDYAECINLCVLLRDRIPEMESVLSAHDR